MASDKYAFLGHREWRFLFLLAALVLLITLYPVFDADERGIEFLGILTSLTLIFGVWAVIDNRRGRFIAILFALPSLVTVWAESFYSSPLLSLAQGLFSIAFYTTTTLVILRHVLRSGRVNRDTIFGAICVYLLMGICWGTAYNLIENLHPGSFFIDPACASGAGLSFSDMIYFSFVALTTTGFGDISAVAGVARSLVALEAVSGVLFIAVFMARIVGLLGQSGTEK